MIDKPTNTICQKCGSVGNMATRKNGPHIEMFCADCLTFQKFLSKKQADRLNSLREKNEKPK